MLCPDISNVTFKGTFQDQFHQYLHFEMLECEQSLLNTLPGYETATCAGAREKAMFFATHMMVGIQTNSYFDTKDLDVQVKTLEDYIINY